METETVKGKAEKTIGHAEGVAGDLTGDRNLEAQGAKDQVKGEFHETVGAIKQAGRDIAAGVHHGTEAAKDDV